MGFNRLVLAIGGMTLSYIISVISMNLYKSLEQTGKHLFFVKLFVFIHFISSMASLFVGLFFHYFVEYEKDLSSQVLTLEFNKTRSDLLSQIRSLSEENDDLRSQLQQSKAISESNNLEKGRTQGYFHGYSIGFEDCMDVLGLPDEQKASMMKMARTSGIHRMKSRPSIFIDQKAVEIDGILR